MKFLALFVMALFSLNLLAVDVSFLCKTDVVERYYVKGEMKLTVASNKKSIIVQLRDLENDIWHDESEGMRHKTNPKTGWVTFKGFSSSQIFGELSEGEADKGIYIYVSPEVISSRAGKISLYARGSEAGLESATYVCDILK